MQFVSTENHAQTFRGMGPREEGGVYVSVSGPIFQIIPGYSGLLPHSCVLGYTGLLPDSLTSAVYSARVKTEDLILSRRTGRTDEIDPRVGSLTGSL